MTSLLNNPKISTLIPFNQLESGALDQIKSQIDNPYLIKMAIMPDCHQGYTLPIGAVALMDGVVSPEFVGVDIGCGMVNVVTDLRAGLLTEDLKHKIFKAIYSSIPNGNGPGGTFSTYVYYKDEKGNPVDFGKDNNPLGLSFNVNKHTNVSLTDAVMNRLHTQCGTLGGGNHFIEIGENMMGYVAITLHSGSRNVGHSIASAYIQYASDTANPGVFLPGMGGFLDIHGEAGKAYDLDRQFAENYALENRKRMMVDILTIIGNIMDQDISSSVTNMVNENHNHAIINEDGTVLHRKGATPAMEDQKGIIPGNMRDGVYLTRGLGNKEFLSSASHGAGRTMGRNSAKRSISLDDFKDSMEGIVASVGNHTLDESPFAYKNFTEVIERQDGIVIDTVDYIKPLINIKA